MKEPWYNQEIPTIWIGEGIKLQNIINIEKYNINDADDEVEGISYYLIDGKEYVIKIIGTTSEEYM